jgi:hypothetical protein
MLKLFFLGIHTESVLALVPEIKLLKIPMENAPLRNRRESTKPKCSKRLNT